MVSVEGGGWYSAQHFGDLSWVVKRWYERSLEEEESTETVRFLDIMSYSFQMVLDVELNSIQEDIGEFEPRYSSLISDYD